MRNRNNYNSLDSAITLLKYEIDAKNINEAALSYLLTTINKIATNQHIEAEVDTMVVSALVKRLVEINKKSLSNNLDFEDVSQVIALWDIYQNMKNVFSKTIKYDDIDSMEENIKNAFIILNDAMQFGLARAAIVNYVHEVVDELDQEPTEDYSEEDIRNIYNKVYSLIENDYPIAMNAWAPFIIRSGYLEKSVVGTSPRLFSAKQLTSDTISPPSTPGKDLSDAMDVEDEEKPSNR